MPDSEEANECDLCRTGKVIRRNEQLAFDQKTDRGTVFCKLTIPISVCERCGAKSWDAAADAIIEAAVRQEYDKLR